MGSQPAGRQRDVRALGARPEFGRRLIAEGVGTGFLVLFGAGSIVTMAVIGDSGGGALGFIALAHALAIALAVYAFGGLSGGHINPAVTFGLAVAGRFPWVEVPGYMLAQLLGGAVGGLLVVAAWGQVAVDQTLVGAPVLADFASYWQAIIAEGLGAFLLVLTIMAVAVDPRAPKGFAGLLIGLSVGVAILATGPIAGAALNPARTFGSYLPAGMFGGSVPWSDFPIYIVGPLIGGALGAVVYDLLAQPRLADVGPPPETPGAGGDVPAAP